MKSLIVYESMYGNTRQIGEALGAAFTGCGWDAQLCNVADAPVQIPADIDLLVVGAPTQAFGMSRSGSRANAAAKSNPESRSLMGVRELTRARRWAESIATARAATAKAP